MIKTGAQFVKLCAAFTGRDGFLALANLGGKRPVGHDRQRFLEALKIVGADKDRSRLPVASHDHAILLALDAIDQLREAGLHRCKRHRLLHD